MSSQNDLSDYERLRLENIRRNAEFLKKLGIESKPVPITTSVKKEKKSDLDIISAEVKKRKREQELKENSLPTRRSARIQNIKVEDVEEDVVTQSKDTEEEFAIDYDSMPLESNELDDHEFQVFVALKAWRLLESRRLEIEPYKICQNRTLAELVRRKRNNLNWASQGDDEKKLQGELLECWGIGPSRATAGGFGHELINLVNNDPKLLDYLEQSRTTPLA